MQGGDARALEWSPPTPAFLARHERKLVGLLLLVGFVLRLVPILWGSIHHDASQYGFHPDESKFVRFMGEFPESLETFHDYRYPTLIPIVYGAAWSVVGGALGMRDDLRSMPGQPEYEAALLFGRGLNVLLFGLGGMLVIWGFARRAFGPGPALMALAMVNLMGRPVTSAALVQPDIPAGVLLLLCLWLLIRISDEGFCRVRPALGVGAALGFAIAAKYTAGIGAIAIAVLAVSAWRRAGWPLGGALRFTLASVLASATAFLVGVPGVLYDNAAFQGSLLYEYTNKISQAAFSLTEFSEAFTQNFPWWVALPAIGGVVLALRRPAALHTVALVVACTVFIGVSHKSFKPDYALLLFPIVAVYAGLGTWNFLCAAPRRPRLALVLSVLVAGHVYSGWIVLQRYASDTHYRFQAWVERNIPPGPIGWAPLTVKPDTHSPKLPLGYELVGVHGRPRWVVAPERAYLHPLRFLEDPQFYRNVVDVTMGKRAAELFSEEPGARRLNRLWERDFLWYEDVLLQRRRDFHYDLVEEFRKPDLPFDMPGLDVKLYRRTRQFPGTRPRE